MSAEIISPEWYPCDDERKLYGKALLDAFAHSDIADVSEGQWNADNFHKQVVVPALYPDEWGTRPDLTQPVVSFSAYEQYKIREAEQFAAMDVFRYRLERALTDLARLGIVSDETHHGVREALGWNRPKIPVPIPREAAPAMPEEQDGVVKPFPIEKVQPPSEEAIRSSHQLIYLPIPTRAS